MARQISAYAVIRPGDWRGKVYPNDSDSSKVLEARGIGSCYRAPDGRFMGYKSFRKGSTMHFNVGA